MKKFKLAAIAVLAASLCLTGCGGASNSNSASYKEEAGAAGDYAYESYAGESYAAEETAQMAEGEEYTADGGSTESALRAQDGQKIVYTGNLSIQTLEYDKSAASIRKKIKDAGGFSEAESERDNDYYWYNRSGGSGNTRYLNITARIPSEKFEDFINSLSGDGKVMSRSVNAENISQVYANKETYKKSLEKEQERLLEMMDKAQTIEEMITVESRLSEVERQLNVYRTDLAQMDKDVEFSTVYIELQEVKRYTEEVSSTTFGEELKYAFEDAINSFKNFCEGIILFVVRNFPYLIILAVIIVLIVRAIGRSRAKRIAMMSDPEYAKIVNAKARAKAEADARKRAEKEAKRKGRKGLFGKKDQAAAEPKSEKAGTVAADVTEAEPTETPKDSE